MSSLITFLWASFLVGTFSFGGGKAYIPVFKSIYVDHFNIISNFKLTEYISYAVTLPGPIAPMITGPVGYELFATKGLILGLLSLTLFPLLLFILVWIIYKNNSNNEKVKMISNYLSPAIIALLLYVCVDLFFEVRVSSNNNSYIYDLYFMIIFVFSSFLLIKTKVHPIILIIISGFLGYYII